MNFLLSISNRTFSDGGVVVGRRELGEVVVDVVDADANQRAGAQPT